MTPLLPAAPKLEKLLPVLGSDKPGEVVAAAAAITRTLEGAGGNWHDLAGAVMRGLTAPAVPIVVPKSRRARRRRETHTTVDPDTAQILHAFATLGGRQMDAWARDFVASTHSLFLRTGTLSEKQRDKLAELVRKWCR